MAAIDSEMFNALFALAFVTAFFILTAWRPPWRRRQKAASGGSYCSDLDDKPQNRFRRVLADNSYSPFKHFKREGAEEDISLKLHPFAEEIACLMEQPPALRSFITSHEFPNTSSSFVWIDTEHQLELLASVLSKEVVFAVDTEQHSLRSFLGFTALMQISTHKEDYLIDTIVLHDMMDILRSVFSDPSICKVFHGADSDVLWLQRDFHLYVVNMFDTAKACEILSKPQKSLAYLLESYCGVTTNKTLQREDWRIRPLPDEMQKYAHNDVHYLLYIAGCLSTELERKTPDISASPDDKLNFIFEASRRSNKVCLQLYVKEVESTPGSSAASSILSRNLNVEVVTSWKSSEAKDLIWILCAWRDLMARIHDESLRYVLSDQAIVALAARAPKRPTEKNDSILHADSSLGLNANAAVWSPSPIAKNHIEDLFFLLQESNADVDDVFKRYWQKFLNHAQCCPLSAYNYALLSEFSLKNSRLSFSNPTVEKFPSTIGKSVSRELFIQKQSCKSPVYTGCRIYASDGRLLGYCDRRKLEWYLRRELARIVEEDPLAIILLFEPKGHPDDEGNEFYIQNKKNMCVGCGEKSHYIRNRIIPSCYRMHFPEHLKSHHDIVLLCVDCHGVARSAAEKYKRKVAKEFGIPLFVQKIVNSGESSVSTVEASFNPEEHSGVSPVLFRQTARTLLHHGSNIPPARLDELMEIVKTYFGRQEISAEDLEAALLVGMSRYDRRWHKKKIGPSFKQNEQNVIYKNDTQISVQSISNDDERIFSARVNKPSEYHHKDADVGSKSLRTSSPIDAASELLIVSDPSVSNNSMRIEDRTGEIEQGKVTSMNKDNEEDDSIDVSRMSTEVTSVTGKNVSFFGHGLHGKQVVEHLLNIQGEEGVRQFCQRWRQVFVDAVHPRFLPSGWDIMHSGRRGFGEHSIYNPARKLHPESSSSFDQLKDVAVDYKDHL